MADLQISQLPSLAEADLAAGDELAVVDGSASETKRITAKALVEKGVALIDAGSIPGSALASLGTDSVVTSSITDGNVTNAKLENSSFSLGGLSISLGSSDSTPALDLTDATNYPASSLTGTITNAQLAGSIANNKLANSSISLAGVSINLGDSNATPAFDLTNATNYAASSLVGTISNTQLAGSIANSKLVNSSINIGGVNLSLGDTESTPAFNLSAATNYPTTALTGTITNAQLAGSIQGSKLVGGSVTSTELGTNSVTANELADLSVDTAALIDSSVTNDKISAVSGTKITANTITASALNTSNIDRSLDVSSGSLGIANVISAGQSLGISYNAQGLITAAVGLSSSDLPISDASNIGGVSIPSGSGLSVTGAGALSLTNSVTATTVSGIEIDSHGLVVSITSLTGTDLPTATTSDKGAVIVQSGGGLQIDGSGNLTTALSGIAAGTYQSVTVNTKGIVTAGQSLTASDIPNISATKITSGTLDIGRFATNSITGQKLADSSVCQFTGATSTSGVVTFPTAEYKGQFFYDLTNDDLYVYDGSAFQPVTITSGEIIYAGNYRADTNKITSLSAAGTAQGFTLDGALVAASAANNRYYFVCDKSGTGTSPAPTVTINPPDMILSNGTSWEKLDISNFIAGQSASNISVTPSGGIQNTNVQSVLEELDNEKLNLSGGTLTGVLNINENSSIVFEGSTPDDFETTLTIIDATQDNTLSLPNVTGTLVSTGDTGSVTSTMIADGTITNTDINASASISISKLEALSSAQIIIGNSSNQPTAVGITGDISIDDAGLASISSGVVVDSDISATAAITGTKIQAGNTSGTVGVLALTDSASSSSTTTAATPAAVKVAKDAADAAASTANAAVEKAGDTMSGNLILGNAKQVRFSELTANGANYVSLQAPDTLAADTSYTLPSALPTAEGQILASTTGGVLSWVSDPAGQWVTSGSDIQYSAGNVDINSDSAKLRLGVGNDLQIYFDGTNSHISAAAGVTYIDSQLTWFRNGAGSENYCLMQSNAGVSLYYDNSKKFETNSSGALMPDSAALQFGAGSDLQLYHDGTNNIIRNVGTRLDIIVNSSETAAKFNPNGAVELYYDNSKKLETTSWGTDVIGILRADELQLTGDNQKLYFGAGPDLQIYHDGSNSYIEEDGTGQIIIRGWAPEIQTGYSPSSGRSTGETAIKAITDSTVELYYDGVKKLETANAGITVSGYVNALGDNGYAYITNDNLKSAWGTGLDLQIYHDGSHSYIDNHTGDLYLRGNTNSIQLRPKDDEWALFAAPNGAVELAYDGIKKLETANYGTKVTGRLAATTSFTGSDNVKLMLGDSDDLQIYHNGTDSYIKNTTGELILKDDSITFQAVSTSDTYLDAVNGGSVELFYDNSKKLETTSTGAILTSGAANTTSVRFGNTANRGLEIKTHQSAGNNDSGVILNAADSENSGYSATLEFQTGGEEKARFEGQYDNFRLSNTCSGITFNGDWAAANRLNDYEEGSWTPEIRKGDSTSNGTATTANGKYVKVGNLIWLQGYYYKSSGSNTATGSWKIFGLPYSIAKLNDSSYQSAGEGYFSMNGTNQFDQGLNWRWQANHNDRLTMYGTLHTTNWNNGGFELSFGGCFLID